MGIATVLAATGGAAAQFAYQEPPDLSNSISMPTLVGTAALDGGLAGIGTDTIRGTVSGSWSSAGFPTGDVTDAAVFVVPAGLTLVNLEVEVTSAVCNSCARRVRVILFSELTVSLGGVGTYTILNGFFPSGAYYIAVDLLQGVPGLGASGMLTYQITATVVPSSNDTCALAMPIGVGITPFHTSAATTDGPEHPTECNFRGDPGIGRDVWFTHTAAADGLLTASTCEGTLFDSKIAIYGGGCAALASTLLACDDDACGSGGGEGGGRVQIMAEAGRVYLIRIGGHAGASGPGNLLLTLDAGGACCNPSGGGCLVMTPADCAALGLTFIGLGTTCTPANCPPSPPPPACPADFNGADGVTVQDIYDFLAAWNQGCP